MSDTNHLDYKAEVERVEHEEGVARVTADLDKLDKLWSDELIINATENIIYTKDHFLMRIRSGQVRFKSFERTISRIAVKGEVVIVTGNESIVPANGPDEGKTVYCSYMNVWVKDATGWQLFGRQVAVIARSPSTSEWVF